MMISKQKDKLASIVKNKTTKRKARVFFVRVYTSMRMSVCHPVCLCMCM